MNGEKNSPTAAHAGHERQLHLVLPGALDYSWTPFAVGVVNRLGWPSGFGIGRQADILSP